MENFICPLMAIIIIALVYWIIRSFNQKIQQQMNDLFSKLSNPTAGPQKNPSPQWSGYQLQAYERMTLFIERIHPANILPRVMQPAQNIRQLQTVLLQTIREEYEHNLSQQLYVSDRAWESCKATKENTIQLIIQTASKLDPTDNAGKLAQELLTSGFNSEHDTIGKTLKLLKQDIRQIG